MATNPVTNVVRKGALAYVGAVAITSDQLVKTIDQLARRGEKVEQSARERIGQATRVLRREANEEIAEGQEQAAQLGDTLANGRDRLFDALNLPTHSDVQKLNFEVARLSAQIEELRLQPRRPKVEMPAAPLPGYEKLNVEALVDRLPALDVPTLLLVRDYEQEHGKRITVLRAVERALVERQAAGGVNSAPSFRTTVDPLPRYEELKAEEIVERLASMHEAELLHVKVYEQEHQNRVTVLRAVDERLVARIEA